MYILYFIYPVKSLVATDCNQSFNVFRIFLSWGNQQPNQPRNGATTTDGPVVFSCIWFSFGLFSGLWNWTHKHYVDWSCWWLVFTSPVQSSFLPPKQATVNCNQSRTDPDIVGTEPDHLGLVFCCPWNWFRPVQTGFFV